MKKALFLDRDGVINIDYGYVHKIEDFTFIEEIFEICLKAQQSGYMIFIITNQGGIARGYYKISDFEKLTHWMEEEFKKRGITITKTYYCPFYEGGVVEEFSKPSFDRKPSPGMFLKAKEEFDIDLSQSLLIGDTETDIIAAKNAGLKESYLMASEGEVAFYVAGDRKQRISKMQLFEKF